MRTIVVLCFLLHQATASAQSPAKLASELQSFAQGHFSKLGPTKEIQTSVISNEMEISHARPIIETAKAGSFLSVGSELAFRAASMMRDPKYVLLVDYDANIVRFNEINARLLQAPTRTIYRKLRWDAGLEEWKQIDVTLTAEDLRFWTDQVRNFYKAPYYLPEMLNRFEDDTNFRTYMKFIDHCMDKVSEHPIENKDALQKLVQTCLDKMQASNYPAALTAVEKHWYETQFRSESIECFKDWKKDFTKVENVAALVDYKTAHYLFDDEHYERLRKLASSKRILSFQGDLNDPKYLQGLVHILLEHQVKISLADLDNLFFAGYLGQDSFHALIAALRPLMDEESLILLMTNSETYACAQYQVYFGLRYDFLAQWRERGFLIWDYLASLQPQTLAHMQGLVYSETVFPPRFSR